MLRRARKDEQEETPKKKKNDDPRALGLLTNRSYELSEKHLRAAAAEARAQSKTPTESERVSQILEAAYDQMIQAVSGALRSYKQNGSLSLSELGSIQDFQRHFGITIGSLVANKVDAEQHLTNSNTYSRLARVKTVFDAARGIQVGVVLLSGFPEIVHLLQSQSLEMGGVIASIVGLLSIMATNTVEVRNFGKLENRTELSHRANEEMKLFSHYTPGGNRHQKEHIVNAPAYAQISALLAVNNIPTSEKRVTQIISAASAVYEKIAFEVGLSVKEVVVALQSIHRTSDIR